MFVRILNSEMELATGCTEPGAVALTAAEAGAALRKAGGTRVEAVTVRASINIIKNAMSAGIPGTSYQGMDYAAAIGAVGGDPVHLLEVMNYVPREQMEEAAALVKAGKVKVEVAQVPQKLYVEVLVTSDGHTGRAVVRDLHTNVVLVEQDGVATLDKQHADPAAAGDSDVVTPEQIAEFLTVRSIWDYCTEELDPMHDPIDIIRSAVQVNTTISNEGLSKEYGLAIGRNLELNCRKGLMTRDLTTNAMVIASAGADARMAGAPVSVVANSGSGNQGITATMPVVATARWLDIDEEKMLRAVTLSNLIAIRIKAKFGRLSNLCGATVAATGAACGIAYLLGGGYHEVCCTIQNMVGNVTGMVCDGAKADCALKISTCVNAACQAAAMGVRGVRVQSTDGIVEHNVEYTLDNFATLSTHGTSDSVILGQLFNESTMGVVVTLQYIMGQLITFCVPLIIIGFIAPSITKLGKNASRLLAVAIIIAYVSSVCAAFMSMGAGYGLIPHLSIDNNVAGLRELPGVVFELNIPQIMSVMSALVLSVLVGLAATWTNSKLTCDFLAEFQNIVLDIVSKVIIPVLPFYIAATFCGLSYEGTITHQLPAFLQIIVIVMVGHYIWLAVLYLLAGAYSGKNPWEVLRHYGPAYLTAVGTMSSAATLGVALECARKSKVLRKDMVSFGIPLFANIHLCGSVLTEVFFCMTVSKILYGKLPSVGTMILFCLLLGIFAIGAPGVPGGTVMASLGLITGVLMFDNAGTALMLAIFALQDSFGTACNVTGDGALTLMLTGYAEKHGIADTGDLESPIL